MCQPPRPRRHAEVFASGVDAIRAQQLLQEIPLVRCHPGRRFDPSSTTRIGKDYQTPIGSRSRWRHRGDVQDALDRIIPTILGKENGPSAFSLRFFAILGRRPEPAPPNQLPVLSEENWRGTAGAFSEQRRVVSGTRPWLCIARRLASPVVQHRASHRGPR